jgi:hypothetical protein
MSDLFSWASEVHPVLLAAYATLSICFIVVFCCITVPLYLDERVQDDELGLSKVSSSFPIKGRQSNEDASE